MPSYVVQSSPLRMHWAYMYSVVRIYAYSYDACATQEVSHGRVQNSLLVGRATDCFQETHAKLDYIPWKKEKTSSTHLCRRSSSCTMPGLQIMAAARTVRSTTEVNKAARVKAEQTSAVPAYHPESTRGRSISAASPRHQYQSSDIARSSLAGPSTWRLRGSQWRRSLLRLPRPANRSRRQHW